MAAYGGVQFNLGAYVGDLGFEPGLAALLITTIALGQIAGKLVVGSLGDKVDHRVLYWFMAGFTGLSLFLYAGGSV